MLDAQRLVPFLKQIRQFALRQLEALISGRQFDFLAVALSINPAGDVERAKDGEQTANMLLFQPRHHATIVKVGCLSHVAGTNLFQKSAEKRGPELKQTGKQVAFHYMRRDSLRRRLRHEPR